MPTFLFRFASANLPKLKAKQLSKAFPFLKLSAAQEATARALGYASWYACTHRPMEVEPSLPDQDAGMAVRVARYYHQANVLIGLGIAPSEADRWVRAWGLTGRPTLAPEFGIPTFHKWNDALARFESGVIDENQLLLECGDDSYSKYPETDRPERICPGVILGPMGKYPHYAVEPSVNARIPIYLRGPHSHYHLEDDTDILEMCVPGFPKDHAFTRIFKRMNVIQNEWHYGQKPPDSSDLLIPGLMAAAMARPDEMMVLSVRAMPLPDGGYDFERHAVACLRGKDFATFLGNKGALNPDAVVWYCDVQDISDLWIFDSWLHGMELETGPMPLPILGEAIKLQPCQPIYSYPFMTAPMSLDEYSGSEERPNLLPLSEDYDEVDDQKEWGNSEAPDTP